MKIDKKSSSKIKKEVPLDSIIDIAMKANNPNIDSVVSTKKIDLSTTSEMSIAGINFGSFMKFQKKHPKMGVDEALDSLQVKKTFLNRFKYNRAEMFNNLFSKKGEVANKLGKEIIGNASIALFILLPLFALFLKLLYIRSKKTYVAHLVFVFHTQTVFFILLSLFFIFNFANENGSDYKVMFLLLFLLYLYLAMKKFYQQGYFKTFVKFILANILFFFLSLIGGTIVSGIALLMF